MTSLSFILPYDFVAKRIRLTWQDILYAVKHNFLSPESATKHAMIELSNSENFPQSLSDLAFWEKSKSIDPYLDELVKLEPIQDHDAINERWMYLVLSWVFVNRSNYLDPLEIVEQIYASFNYPEEITDFVRYMPSKEPDLGSLEKNEARLYKKWEDYLKVKESKYTDLKIVY